MFFIIFLHHIERKMKLIFVIFLIFTIENTVRTNNKFINR